MMREILSLQGTSQPVVPEPLPPAAGGAAWLARARLGTSTKYVAFRLTPHMRVGKLILKSLPNRVVSGPGRHESVVAVQGLAPCGQRMQRVHLQALCAAAAHLGCAATVKKSSLLGQ